MVPTIRRAKDMIGITNIRSRRRALLIDTPKKVLASTYNLRRRIELLAAMMCPTRS
jgi:hypothetical protein